MPEIRYDFIGKLDGRTVLGDGSVRFSARLTRTGVFDYGDHKELRTPEEVFNKDSMASFKGLAVTVGHQAFIDAENWRSYSVGHVGDDVHQEDGKFLDASIVVKDKDTLAKIDAGELVELSMGYLVNLDATSGEHEGEKYDAIQRDIVGNHAALGPVGWGRAGSNVRLLDGAAYPPGMTLPVQRIDAPSASTDAADLAAARADNEAVRKERDQARADAVAATKRADTAEAERDAARKDAKDAKDAADAAAKAADAKVDGRIALLDSARGILGTEVSFTGKSDREVRIAALTKVDPNAKFDGKSDDYVTARFDIACESVKTDRTALAQLNVAVDQAAPAGEKSRLDQALENQAKERAEQAKGGVPKGAMTRPKS